MSSGAYLIPSGYKEGTSLFARAMSWGASDPNFGGGLPSGDHQLICINNANQTYGTFTALGTTGSSTQNPARGYLASFLIPTISGWSLESQWKYDTWAPNGSGATEASGLLDKLQSQNNNTLLILSTRDEPYSNSSIFTGELVRNWGAAAITGMNSRSSYVLVAVKNKKAIYEEMATSGNGPVGFCGWIKRRDYESGIWYTETDAYMGGALTTGYATSVINRTGMNADESIHAYGFFKTTLAGDYSIKLVCSGVAALWLGDFAASGYTTGNAQISISGDTSGAYNFTLSGNTAYPFRLQYGTEVNSGSCILYQKFENEAYSTTLPVKHIYYQTGVGAYASWP